MHGPRLRDNHEMRRTRSAGECATCKKTPSEDASGRLTCACGTPWVRRWGIKGTPEEEDLLQRSGFEVTQHCKGDVYYVVPNGPIIHLYAGDEWNSEPCFWFPDQPPEGQSLETT